MSGPTSHHERLLPTVLGAPMSTGSSPNPVRTVLGGGLRVYRRAWQKLLIISAITTIPVALIAYMIARESIPAGAWVEDGQILLTSPESLSRLNLVMGIAVVMTIFGSLLSMASLHVALADQYFTGDCDWRSSLRTGLRNAPGVLAIAVANVIAVVLPVVLIERFGSTDANSAVVVATFLAIVVIWAMTTIVGMVAIPTMVREGCGPVAAVTRAWDVLTGGWVRTLSALLVCGVIALFVHGALNAAFDEGLRKGATSVGTVLISVFVPFTLGLILLAPLTAAIVTVAYFDQRLRHAEDPTLDPVATSNPIEETTSDEVADAQVMTEAPTVGLPVSLGEAAAMAQAAAVGAPVEGSPDGPPPATARPVPAVQSPYPAAPVADATVSASSAGPVPAPPAPPATAPIPAVTPASTPSGPSAPAPPPSASPATVPTPPAADIEMPPPVPVARHTPATAPEVTPAPAHPVTADPTPTPVSPVAPGIEMPPPIPVRAASASGMPTGTPTQDEAPAPPAATEPVPTPAPAATPDSDMPPSIPVRPASPAAAPTISAAPMPGAGGAGGPLPGWPAPPAKPVGSEPPRPEKKPVVVDDGIPRIAVIPASSSRTPGGETTVSAPAAGSTTPVASTPPPAPAVTASALPDWDEPDDTAGPTPPAPPAGQTPRPAPPSPPDTPRRSARTTPASPAGAPRQGRPPAGPPPAPRPGGPAKTPPGASAPPGQPTPAPKTTPARPPQGPPPKPHDA